MPQKRRLQWRSSFAFAAGLCLSALLTAFVFWVSPGRDVPRDTVAVPEVLKESSFDEHLRSESDDHAGASQPLVAFSDLQVAVGRASAAFSSDYPPAVSALVEQAAEILELGVDGNRQVVEEASRVAEQIRHASLDWLLSGVFEGGSGAVDLVDLETGALIYSLDANEPWTAASTYKLFVLYDMLASAEQGEQGLEGDIYGTWVEDCLFEMIVYSANDCAEDWLYSAGYDHMNGVAQSLGARGTSFQYGELTTTARDLSNFLGALYSGELLNREHTEWALQIMGQQEFRDGIPAGVGKYAQVADKVGWLDEVYNDAAIITGEKGEHVMVILTYDLPAAATAEAARILYDWI